MTRTVGQPDVLTTTECLQPTVVAFVDFGAGAGIRVYGTKLNPNGSWDGSIVEVSPIQSQVKIGTTGMATSMTLTLDDRSDLQKLAIDFANPFQATVHVQAYYEGIAGVGTTLFRGTCVNPVNWREGERLVTLTFETDIYSGDVGYAFEEGDFGGNNDVGIGKVWPLVFGKPAHVPGVLVRTQPRAKLKKPIQFLNAEDSEGLLDLAARNIGGITFTHIKMKDLRKIKQAGLVGGVFNEIEVDDADGFPQGEEILIQIDGVIFRGSFTDEVFTIVEANAQRYPNVVLAVRDTEDKADENNPQVFWITDKNKSLVNSYVYFGNVPQNEDMKGFGSYAVKDDSEPIVRLIVHQEGTKCWMDKEIVGANRDAAGVKQTVLIDNTHKITENRGLPPNGMLVDDQKTRDKIRNISQWRSMRKYKLLPSAEQLAIDPSNPWGAYTAQMTTILTYVNLFLGANPGAVVRRWESGTDDVYVVNSVESSEVHAVYGVRRFKNEIGEDQDHFLPIPKCYYSVELAEDTGISDYPKATTIHFARPLSEYKNQGWKDEVYVTMTSDISDNTADQIEYILENFTDLDVDGASFASVAASLSGKLSHFAIFSKWDALTLAEAMAWQAGCVLRVEADSVDIINLTVDPSINVIATDESVEFKSISTGFTNVNEVVTKLVGEWRATYEPILDTSPDDQKEFNEVIATENLDLYGEREEVYDFFIYNERDHVEDTLDFWKFRYGNVWRTLQYRAFTQFLGQQVYDTPLNGFTDSTILRTSIKGTFNSLSHNIMDGTVDVSIWLPSPAGQVTEHPDAWPN